MYICRVNSVVKLILITAILITVEESEKNNCNNRKSEKIYFFFFVHARINVTFTNNKIVQTRVRNNGTKGAFVFILLIRVCFFNWKSLNVRRANLSIISSTSLFFISGPQ